MAALSNLYGRLTGQWKKQGIMISFLYIHAGLLVQFRQAILKGE